MLPHNHFLIAGTVIYLTAVIFFPEKSLPEIVRWILAGGITSMAIDSDVYLLVILKAKKQKQLKLFKNPLEIYRKFPQFMDTITETGVLKSALKTHLLVSLLLIVIVHSLYRPYFIPLLLGIVSHLLSDIPNLSRIVKQTNIQE